MNLGLAFTTSTTAVMFPLIYVGYIAIAPFQLLNSAKLWLDHVFNICKCLVTFCRKHRTVHSSKQMHIRKFAYPHNSSQKYCSKLRLYLWFKTFGWIEAGPNREIGINKFVSPYCRRKTWHSARMALKLELLLTR